MRKLEIDYDFIDKIYESEGKYKIKRFMMENKFSMTLASGFITKDILLGVIGKTTPEQTIVNISEYVSILALLYYIIDSLNLRIKEKTTGKTREERAEDKLENLVAQLNNINIDVNLDNLKEANVYHKKYRLRKDGKVGIIRERYIEIPVDEKSYNFNEDSVSIKEEHVMGSNSYVLTLGKPPKEMVYKPAFNM